MKSHMLFGDLFFSWVFFLNNNDVIDLYLVFWDLLGFLFNFGLYNFLFWIWIHLLNFDFLVFGLMMSYVNIK